MITVPGRGVNTECDNGVITLKQEPWLRHPQLVALAWKTAGARLRALSNKKRKVVSLKSEVVLVPVSGGVVVRSQGTNL